MTEILSLTLDGHRSISASDDITLKVWDIESDQIIANFCGDSSLKSWEITPKDGNIIIPGRYPERYISCGMKGLEQFPGKGTQDRK